MLTTITVKFFIQMASIPLCGERNPRGSYPRGYRKVTPLASWPRAAHDGAHQIPRLFFTQKHDRKWHFTHHIIQIDHFLQKKKPSEGSRTKEICKAACSAFLATISLAL
ncbi:hypothetical protein WL1483_3714 [Aeromonas schubertii]|uniref:Uncharacterized protein n=1 Tax=Aeromonas schubertii TaxID=652 RepID=A0A0S2SN13_9GAMM|nr:hypothetical protein WL1483_3714 [Aeromonas schubertii]